MNVWISVLVQVALQCVVLFYVKFDAVWWWQFRVIFYRKLRVLIKCHRNVWFLEIESGEFKIDWQICLGLLMYVFLVVRFLFVKFFSHVTVLHFIITFRIRVFRRKTRAENFPKWRFFTVFGLRNTLLGCIIIGKIWAHVLKLKDSESLNSKMFLVYFCNAQNNYS